MVLFVRMIIIALNMTLHNNIFHSQLGYGRKMSSILGAPKFAEQRSSTLLSSH
jgi:hypothetical protein